MCGIFGFFGNTPASRPRLRMLEELAVITESRGRHSFGFSWVDGRNRLLHYKQPGAISSNLEAIERVADARALIGHCRYATHGNYKNNLNNHPHPCDAGWMIHNGVIHNHCKIADEYGIDPVTDCDSEILARLVEELEGETVLERVTEAVEICAPGPLAAAFLWKPAKMVLVRNGHPLHIAWAPEGLYFASLRDGLPDGAAQLDARHAFSFEFAGGKQLIKKEPLFRSELVETEKYRELVKLEAYYGKRAGRSERLD